MVLDPLGDAIGPSVLEQGLNAAAFEEKATSDVAALLDPDPDTGRGPFADLMEADPELALALARNVRERLILAGTYEALRPMSPECGEVHRIPPSSMHNRVAMRRFGTSDGRAGDP